MSRAVWFAVGTGAGVYATLKARRLVYRLSPEGLADQVAALRLGVRTLAADVREGMTEREDELLEQLGLARQGEEGGDGRRAPEGLAAVTRTVTGAAPALAARSHPVRRDIP